MTRRRPEHRLVEARTSDNPKRKLREPGPSLEEAAALAARVRYEGYAKHKLYPRAFGLEPISGVSDDPTFCDGHAGFEPGDMPLARDLLSRGVRSGLISQSDRQGDPALIWTIDDRGWIFEARLTTAGQALYHGYPVLPGDAIASKVVERFADWVYGGQGADHADALANAQDRYAK